MNTLTPKIIKKFHPVFTVPEYQKLLEKYYRIKMGYTVPNWGKAEEEFWRKLPETVLAKCPICGAEHTDRIDLHTTAIVDGSRVDASQLLFFRTHPYSGCKHWVRTISFINLNGEVPQRDVFFGSEVPYVTDYMFPPNIQESYAVINAFPLCKIEEGKFKPTYTLYLLTYYGTDPTKLRDLKNLPEGEWFSPPVLYSVDEAWENRDKKIFDLKYWVEQGRLFWIDEEDGKTILRNDPETFPYVNIKGYVEKMMFFKDGTIQTFEHNNTPRYYPDWKPEDWSKRQWKHFYKNEKRDPHARWRRGCLSILTTPIVLFILVVVTSLFFWPIIDPVWAWMLMLGAIGTVLYLAVKSSFSLYEEGQISSSSEAISQASINVFGVLLTTGSAVFAGGWAVRKVGLFVLAQTDIEWLGVGTGMLGALVAGFGAGKIVGYIWGKATKGFR